MTAPAPAPGPLGAGVDGSDHLAVTCHTCLMERGDSNQPSINAESRRDRLGLLTAYYNATRAEVLQRQMIRESTLTLFLGASATLAAVAFTGEGARRWLLFFVPLLGLGASCVHLQHTTATRALWHYLAGEFQREVEWTFAPESAPIQWDISTARQGLSSAATMRAAGAATLIVIPGLITAFVAAFSLGWHAGSVAAFIVSILAVATSGSFVIYGFARRPLWYAQRSIGADSENVSGEP
jgi:hypothetical protein